MGSVAAATAQTAEGAPAPPAPSQMDQRIEEGRNHFLANCSACHAVQGLSEAGEIAPNLTLLGRRATIAAGLMENTVDNLVQWISDPQAIKPGALMPGLDYPGGREGQLVWPAFNLTPEQVESVALYLHSLR